MSSSEIPVLGPVIKHDSMNVRPLSASGNIQSHPIFTTGLYDKKTKLKSGTKEEQGDSLTVKKSLTHLGKLKQAHTVIEPKDEVEKRRRRTLEVGDNIDIRKFIGREMSLTLSKQNLLEKVEERLDIEVLEELKRAFEDAEKNANGTLNLSIFKSVLIDKLQLQHAQEKQTVNLFNKIDWASTQAISWDDFCTYMQLEYEEKEETYSKAREMAFNLPARVENTPHRYNVHKITSTTDGTFIAGSTDGLLSFWNSNLELKKAKSVLTNEQSQRLKLKWIIDFQIMTEFNKIIVGTGDREIEFFELSSFEPYCRICSLETVPLCLDYYVDRDNSDDSVILWGDRHGCVNILHLYSTGESLRTWKKQPRSEGIASVDLTEAILSSSTVTFGRWKVHNDWLLKIKYYESLRQVISCSKDESSALVIGCLFGSSTANQTTSNSNVTNKINTNNKSKSTNNKLENEAQQKTMTLQSISAMMKPKKRQVTEQTVFCIYKGIQTFDFGPSKNVLVTGGLDRIIRIWNPYVNSKPIGMLRGHNKPIVHLHIAESENRIFSICADKCVKVWDLHDHNCLLTVRPKGHRIRGDVQACHYSESVKSLMIATDQMSMLNIKVKPVLHTDVALSHKESVNCCRYNEQFNSVITCCEGGIVKVWNFDNGEKIFEYNDAHDDGGITCMTFDSSLRRMLTGGRDGVVRMWNFNNGQCLTQFDKEDPMKETNNHVSEEIRDVKYVEISRNKFILAVGWDKMINMYIDRCEPSMHRSYKPTDPWIDDINNGHEDDILCMATLRGNLLATGDYGGTIIIWNLMSGHMFYKIVAPPADIDTNSDYLDEDLSINKLIFLQNRYGNNNSASLISSGPYGLVHLWNVKHPGGKLYARFKGGLESGQSLTAMVTCKKEDKPEGYLIVGDRFGFISVWDIETYGIENAEIDCPPLCHRWRAHVGTVTDLDAVPSASVLITASDDRTVRLWTLNTNPLTIKDSGQFIGTLGQTEPWNLSQPLSFQHPMVPFDVLIDPRSLPNHPVLGPRMSVEQRKQRGRDEASERRKARSAKPTEDPSITQGYISQKSSTYIDDKTINDQVRQKIYKDSTGKRLIYERKKVTSSQLDDGGPNEYRSLYLQDIKETLKMDRPNFSSSKDDNFDLNYKLNEMIY